MAFILTAAVGSLLGELLHEVLELKKKEEMFESVLESMEASLTSLTQAFEQIKVLNKELDRESDKEIRVLWKQIEKGKKLVIKIKQPKCSSCLKMPFYMKELERLDDSLKRFSQIVMPVLQAWIQMETLKAVKVIKQEVIDMRQDLCSSIQTGKAARPVSNNNVPLRPFMRPEPPQVTVGLDKPLKDLKNELFKDGMSMVVLTAPGGCGKTTLAKKLCQDEDIKGKFEDNIFFITVSKSPDLKVIIQQLFQHKGYSVHEFRTDEEAVNRLEQLLKQIGNKPVLLILDDVWSGSESLLDKFKFQIPEYKILLTSRSTLQGFGSIYKLDTLNYEDSMSLFRQTAGLQNGTSNNVEDDVVKKIVNFCKGVPLALTVVGRSLRQQPPAIWKNKVKQWSKGGAFIESNTDLLTCLKSSLDVMDNKLKECYIDLGAFPEGHLIPATAIIDMWEELYEMNGDGLNTISNLHELSSLNLIDLVVTRKDGSEIEDYNEIFVTQHDLLRDLVNHLSGLIGAEQGRKTLVVDINRNEFPSWWKTISALLLSISTDESFSSNWSNIQASEAEVLVLNFRTKDYTLPEFIKSMDKLKTLILTNYGFFSAEISNFVVLENLSNLKRIRLEQVLIPSLIMNCKELKNLQKISLLRCNFGPAFSDKAIQISDALPKLVEINISYCNNLIELPVGLCNSLPKETSHHLLSRPVHIASRNRKDGEFASLDA